MKLDISCHTWYHALVNGDGTKTQRIKALARKAKVTPRHIYRVLSGTCVPSIRVARALSTAMGITIDELTNLTPANVAKETKRK